MQDIELTVLLPAQVKVFRPMYRGRVEIFINKLRQGTMEKLNGVWVANLNPESPLTADDISILGEMLDSQGNKT